MYLKMIIVILFLTSVLFSSTGADPTLDEETDVRNNACKEFGDCPIIKTDCAEKCGCDEIIPTFFDNTTQECVVDMKLLLGTMTEKYNTAGKQELIQTIFDALITKVRAEADKIFQGIIIAALFFIVCASSCVIMACIYCCRINYTDYKLKKIIGELEKKVGANSDIRKPTNKTPVEPVSESCNVIVEDAGVFCV